MNRITKSIFILLFAMPYCATTTVNTGPVYQYPDDDGSFFRPTSDPSSRKKKEDCNCDNEAQANKNADIKRNVALRETPQTGEAPENRNPDRQTPNKEETVVVTPASVSGDYEETGTASWYGRDFDGKKTASGEIFDSRKLTAAHKKLPLGTVILVKNLENGREAVVTVNDRGPFVAGRILDISEYGAETLGYKEKGLTMVGIKVVRSGDLTERSPGATSGFFKDRPQAVNAEETYRPNLTTTAVVNPNEGDANSGNNEEKEKPKFTRDAPDESSMMSYTVQLAVFNSRENAENYKYKLKNFRQPVHVLKRGSDYVVKIGKFNNRSEAEVFKNKLYESGVNGFVSDPGR